MVLEVLKQDKMHVKLNQCDFYHKSVKYFGHLISEEGISMDLEKIETIMNWPTPRNVTNVRSFKGLVGYYRRLIKGLSKIAYSITFLQKKGNIQMVPRM
jgi:hypothetical protein